MRYHIRHELFLRPDQTTFTFRNKMDQTALPIRSWGAFMPPNGVGGGGVHWNGQTYRFLPSDFVLRTHLTERYGKNFIPEDMTIQDYGVTYDDLEPHYDHFEYLCGTSGTAGNLNGQKQHGGNPFEGARSRPYPNPPQKQGFAHALFGKAAGELGYQAFPAAVGQYVAGLHEPARCAAWALHLLRLLRVVRLCELFQGQPANHHPAGAGAQVELLGAGQLRSHLDQHRPLRQACHRRDVRRFSGEEWEQPADLVILSAFSVFNVQLLLLSKIGQPYDPVANTGVIGRNFTHQTMSGVDGFFDNKKFNFNPFIASGAIGMIIDDFNGDNFDHGPLGFVGGGYLAISQTNGRPITTTPMPPSTPKWGAQWKNAVRDNYLSTVSDAAVHGSMYSYRDVYLDLDPTYKDRFGRPLMRMNIDFHDNELKAAGLSDRQV